MGSRALLAGAAYLNSHWLAWLALVLVLAGCSQARYDGPVSDHFDGREFHNEEPFPHTFSDLIGYVLKREPIEWSTDEQLPPRPAPRQRIDKGELQLTWVNHATVLIQADGLNLLTDPIWSERASPLGFAGPQRHHPPGVAFADLPPIDVVMISHSHYDHMDFASLERLHQAHDPLFVVPLGNGALLQPLGIDKVVELDWWQGTPLSNGCVLSAVPVKHWSNRRVLPSDRNLSLWAGFVLQTGAGPVYFGGDSGYDTHYLDTYERYGAMRASLLPIGAYLPRWFMAYQHTGPVEAVQAHRDLASAFSLGIHWGTFKLAPEGRFQPADLLSEARRAQAVAAADFIAPEPGARYDVPPLAGGSTCHPMK